MGCHLSLAEYMLWERQCKKQFSIFVSIYGNDPSKPNLVFEQISGEGNFQKLSDQTNIPEAAPLDIANTAKTTLHLTPDYSIPTQSFASIKQGANESFIKFVVSP